MSRGCYSAGRKQSKCGPSGAIAVTATAACGRQAHGVSPEHPHEHRPGADVQRRSSPEGAAVGAERLWVVVGWGSERAQCAVCSVYWQQGQAGQDAAGRGQASKAPCMHTVAYPIKAAIP